MIFSRNPAKRRVQVKSAFVTALVISAIALPTTVIMRAVDPGPQPPADFLGHSVVAPVELTPVGPTFEVRKDCRIARFGVAPWLKPGMPKGAEWEQMTRLWLSSIGMPVAGHDGAIATLRGKRAGEVMITNTTGAFTTSYRVGDRWVSCLNSTTRFIDDTVQEPADSYPYTYAGKRYDLVIIQRCGNVTELPPAPVVVLPPPVLSGPAATPPGAFFTPPAPYPLPGPGWPHSGPPGAPPMVFLPPPPVAPPVYQVDEPPTWLLTLLAVAGAAWFHRRKK